MATKQSPAIAHLISGYQVFRAQSQREHNKAQFQKLVEEGQSPKTLIISCCDSRVEPAHLFDTQPGELFVVRNVANLVPPYEKDPLFHGTSAAIEFAVCHLHVSDIIILGHSHCGGIKALMDGTTCTHKTDFIEHWMSISQHAKEETLAKNPGLDKEALYHECEKTSAAHSLKNLMTFPWIKTKVQANELALHAWYFDLNRAEIEAYDVHINNFTPLI